jgi:16S rRNA (adenine1518-N6/adenine1519-N6)-dimethyltransferase
MKAKKTLGQHFLKDKNILGKIVDAAEVKPDDFILEIGPGTGTLTELLLQSGARVIAVEKDSILIKELNIKFSKFIKEGRLELIHSDVLNFDPEHFFASKKYKVVANIPYYITGNILRKFLGNECQPESMTLLVQKEVAERIVARDKKESLLSISVKVYGNPKIIQTVKRGSFSPMPKVDSAIIHISDISKKNFKKIDEENFFKILKAGFAHKRKVLIKNLESVYSREALEEIFNKCEISLKARAEDLSLEQWLCLVNLK